MYGFNYQLKDTYGGEVNGLEDVRATRVDPNGNLTFFYSKAEGKVYSKHIDMTGLPVIEIFNKVESPQESLDKRVAHLEELMKEFEDNMKTRSE